MAQDEDTSSRQVIQDGHTVIIRKLYEPDDLRMVKISRESTYSFFGQRVTLGHFIGIPYGSIVEIDRSNKIPQTIELTDGHFNQLFHLHNVDNNTESVSFTSSSGSDLVDGNNKESTYEPSPASIVTQKRDNRNLVDDQKSQKLSADQIEHLKSSSVDSNEIVGQLVANSDTFTSKTAFAQAKYIKKKKEKYILLIQVLKPSIRLITQYYYVTSSFKSLSLRVDSVGQILSSLNVQSSGVYMIIDTSIGLLTASLLDRIIGHGNQSKAENNEKPGKVIQIYTEAGPVASWREAIEALNYDESLMRKCLFSLPFAQLVQLMKHGKVTFNDSISIDGQACSTSIDELSAKDDSKSCPNGSKSNETTEDASIAVASGLSPMEIDTCNSTSSREVNTKAPFKRGMNRSLRELDDDDQAKWREKKKKKLERKSVRRLEEIEAVDTLSTMEGTDGFILVARGHSIEPIVRVLLNFIRSSAPFVIYSPTINCLMDVAISLKDQAVNLSIHESWMRKYQVLPERTRPEMSMSGSSGYILTGTKVYST